MGTVLTPALMREIRGQFRLDWQGVHGAPHWARVRHHGVTLARQVGADVRVAEIFAVIHDSQRENDWTDPAHGQRAADYAARLRRRGLIELDKAATALLQAACRGHSDGYIEADITVQVCWDADRLDLGRVGMRPDARRLCTPMAKTESVIEHAWCWSQRAPARFGFHPGQKARRGISWDEDGMVSLQPF